MKLSGMVGNGPRKNLIKDSFGTSVYRLWQNMIVHWLFWSLRTFLTKAWSFDSLPPLLSSLILRNLVLFVQSLCSLSLLLSFDGFLRSAGVSTLTHWSRPHLLVLTFPFLLLFVYCNEGFLELYSLFIKQNKGSFCLSHAFSTLCLLSLNSWKV